MRVLVACEYTGAVRDAFIARGHNAMSCDLRGSDSPGPHYRGDVRDILGNGFDLLIAHPPCTDIAVAGAKHFAKKGAAAQTAALEFVSVLANAPIARIAIENPVSIISSRLGPPTQIIQPWQFGESFQKTTCLWLHWLPPLRHTEVVDAGEFVTTPSGARIPKWYSNRKGLRNRTFAGIAAAMAEQWGCLPTL